MTRLYCASTKELNIAQRQALLEPFYFALDRLTLGRLDLEDFIQLNEANVFGFQLARRLWLHCPSEDGKALIEPSQADFEAAAEALATIGEREKRTGKFGATGDELMLLRNAFAWLDQLINVADEGHTLTALREAAEMISSNLMR